MPISPKNNDVPKKRTVLITRFSALGDVAMAIPVVYGVCRANPDVDFVMVTAAPLKALFINPPANLTVVQADIHGSYAGPRGIVRLTRELIATYGATDLADIHDVIRTSLMRLTSRLSGLRVAAIDKGRADKRALTRKEGRRLQQLPTSAERYARVFRNLGLDVDLTFTSLWGNSKADPSVFATVTPPKTDGERWVGIAPFAAHRGKVYPPERMERVIALLTVDPSVKIFLFGGGAEERTVLGQWASRHPRVVSLAEKRHGFALELALMSHLDCLVAMDSGNAHLASLTGTPVITIWGATHPFAGFTAWRQQPDDMLQSSTDCRPCSVFGNKACIHGDYRCFRAITPEVVAARIRSHLAPQPNHTPSTNS